MSEPTFDLPISIKEKLLQLCRHLPEDSQGKFLTHARDRLSKLALEHTNTIVFATLGWLLGEILDHVLTVHVPFSDLAVCLTGDRISTIGLAAGALYGLSRDIQAQRARADVARVIGEELRRVLAGGNT